MDGILCINKPKGFTSFDVVAKTRKILNIRRIGHGGTLDPMAEGVLPLFIGRATKAVDFCPDNSKEYIAGFRFGITTDTQDITGKVLDKKDIYVSRNKMIFIERIKGEVEQIPPMYSAVRVNGTRLYDLARKGEEIERTSRKINIYSVKVLEYKDNRGIIKVKCGKGTYIRTLIHDFGQQLGVGAVMTSLTRTMSSGFSLSQCLTIEELEEIRVKEGEPGIIAKMTTVEQLYSLLPKARLDAAQTRMFSNGVKLLADKVRLERIYDGMYSIYDCNGYFGAIAIISGDHTLKIIQRFMQPEVKLTKGVKGLNND
ncbi:MAG: tRNA pseudouridine(55) synthase TruB [Eubacterium sp.]|jgi:tRNA pseudouridine55 synthase|nr:tRNA pseudouridine(55) synthase TruB [Eubacterium sp.]